MVTKPGQDESESAPMCSNSTNQATENTICLKAQTEANKEKVNASSCLDSPQTPASDDEIDCMSQGQLDSRLEIESKKISKTDLEISDEHNDMLHLIDSDEEEGLSSSDESETVDSAFDEQKKVEVITLRAEVADNKVSKGKFTQDA